LAAEGNAKSSGTFHVYHMAVMEEKLAIAGIGASGTGGDTGGKARCAEVTS
jgi:hypothetical protein